MPHSLLLHREDGTLFDFNLFSKDYSSYNMMITGKSGSGKSVFGNLLSSSLLNDPAIRMIKVDVGGSYRKECEAYQGEEIQLRIDQPCGLNPFWFFEKNSSEVFSILSEFLGSLILEEKETSLTRLMKADLEKGLREYAEKGWSADETPSLDDFLSKVSHIPRKPILERWSKAGIYGNFFNHSIPKRSSRYTYFNFENIQSASQSDLTLGILATVVAQINLEMAIQKDFERMVFFCDEMNFFIHQRPDLFLLTTSNFRKFGNSVILIGQNIQNFELTKPNGEKDLGLMINCPTQVFFKTNVPEHYLKEHFQLGDREIDVLLKMEDSAQNARKAILKDDLGTRRINIILTEEEYWRVTSKKEDLSKFNQIKTLIPGFNLSQMVQLLGFKDQR